MDSGDLNQSHETPMGGVVTHGNFLYFKSIARQPSRINRLMIVLIADTTIKDGSASAHTYAHEVF